MAIVVQKIALLADFGSKAMRVLDALTPLTGTEAPTMNAKFIGQTFVRTDTGKVYVAIAKGTGASDWAILN